jgi:hypothetical protein
MNSQTGWAAGVAGRVYRTTNGGLNWSLHSAGASNLRSVFFTSANRGWAAGSGNTVFYTINGGTNWIAQPSGTSIPYLNDIYFVNDNEGWAAGDYGTIIHTTTGGIGVKNISAEIPAYFKLYQNYPNPFNPVTRIKFDIPAPLITPKGEKLGAVTLKVYDILGREVAVLLDEPLIPGTYEIEWSAAEYPSGLYFYRIESQGFSETRKMIVLK